jgi:hypothetical protein
MQSSSFRYDWIHKCLRYDFSHTSLWYISHTWMFNQVTSGFWTLLVEQKLKLSCNFRCDQICNNNICDLSSDLNVVMRKTDALRWLWKRYPYRDHLSCLSPGISVLCFFKSVDLCTDVTSLFLICSALHTHTLSVSPLSSFLSPPLCLHKNPWQTFSCYHWSQ